MGDVELVGLYWTLSGPVDVHVGREWSLFAFEDRCAEAAKVGFDGIGIWHADLAHLLETHTLARPEGDPRRRRPQAPRARVPHGLVPRPRRPAPRGGRPPAPLPLRGRRRPRAPPPQGRQHPRAPRRRSSRSRSASPSCAPTRPSTTARRSPTSSCRSTRTCGRSTTSMAVAAGAGAPNGGIAIDTWHMGKLGIAPEELRRIPLEHLAWVELSDGQYEDMPDPVDETINHRRLPGEGEFDVAGYVAVCATWATPGRGGSRCSPRSCATCPSRRSSSGPTRRPARSSARASGDTERGAAVSDNGTAGRARPRAARLGLHPDAADPRVRGARQAHVRGAPGRHPRPHAPGRRRRGVDRRLDRRAARRRPADGDLPLPRLPDRARARRPRR